jgi:hypothetical protein
LATLFVCTIWLVIMNICKRSNFFFIERRTKGARSTEKACKRKHWSSPIWWTIH